MLLWWSVHPLAPLVPGSLSFKLNLIVLKLQGCSLLDLRCGMLCWRWHEHPPPPLYKGPHPAPAVLLWSDSQYCAVSHGEEIIPRCSDQALAGTSRVVRRETRIDSVLKGREKKEADSRGIERKTNWDVAVSWYIQPKTAACSALFRKPSYISTPLVFHRPLTLWVSAVPSVTKL